jgi:mono/diheme cytochrome c family protein
VAGRISNLIAALIVPAGLAQNSPTSPDIKQTYAKLCAGCHGADARGTQQGPGLAGNASVRRRSFDSVRRVIRNGIPAAAMPGFDLPDASLDELAKLVISLNAYAADTAVPGNADAGKQFFFGKGRCGSCHMVSGQGSPIGPDLSNVARQMTVDELRESLLRPDARIGPDTLSSPCGCAAARRCAASSDQGPSSTSWCRTSKAPSIRSRSMTSAASTMRSIR